MSAPLRILPGAELVVDVLRWHEGWDFDCPVCVLRPVVRFSPNGESAEQLVESLCLDACVDGALYSEAEDGLVDRQFPIGMLKRRWAAARRGVVFPVRQYKAYRFRVRFHPNTLGELEFDMEDAR